MPWTDRDLEVRYTFCRFLDMKLRRRGDDRFRLDGEVDLARYRLARIGETNIDLEKGRGGELKGPTDVGTRKADDETVHLSDIIQQLNLRFGTDFTEADKLLFGAVVADEVAKTGVRDKAHANSFENFRIAAKTAIEGAMIDRMDRNADVVSKFLNEEDFKAQVVEWIAKQIYEKARGEAA
jgi:type I restriction enzyme R subunit